MIDQDISNSVSLSRSSNFVRKYLTGIFLIIALIVLSVFWGFSFRSNALIKDQLRQQGQSFFQEIVLTREWAANHGGVYVRLTPGEEINPFLMKIPGIKVSIKDQDGQLYILKNPALMTREISELAAAKGIFKFRITSLEPLNPENKPDSFEQAALMKFDQGAMEYFSYETRDKEILYRYMAPLVTRQPCLQCHEQQGYRDGDVRGGISVTITATDMMRQIKLNQYYIILSAIGILTLIFAIFRFISQMFIKEIKESEQQLMDMASRDFLTGLLNRREAFRRIGEEVSRSSRSGKPISFIMIDIDHFKQINDTYGHSTGDFVLKELSRHLKEIMRDYDIVCRYGGEEFLVVTPEATREKAQELAERIRNMAMQLVIPLSTEMKKVDITVSAGVALMIEGENFEKVLTRTDAALYRAKESGRNCIVVA